MIRTKKHLTTRGGGFFPNPKTLYGAGSNQTLFVLENTYVKYVFERDLSTGLRLDSFTAKDGNFLYTNKSRSLWKLGIMDSLILNRDLRVQHRYNRVIYPTGNNFKYPYSSSLITEEETVDNSPIRPEGANYVYFKFVWVGVNYDNNYLDKKLNVILTVKLYDDLPTLEMELSLESVPGVASYKMTSGSTVAAVGFPELAFRRDTSKWDQDILLIGSLFGESIRNPIKHLESPRYDSEDVSRNQYLLNGQTRTFKFKKGGGPPLTSPSQNPKILNLGSPGYLSIPAFIYGNRDDKAGVMYYALDSDGLHAKNMQVFSDGYTLHMRAWDLSDSEIAPYGVGGKWREGYSFNTKNNIGWKVRIRPFRSPTKWVDWYGAKLYKQDVVQEQEELGWMPKSFYERYVEGELTAEEVEMPYYATAIGHMTGNADDIHESLGWYQTFYKGLSNSEITPRIICHTQELILSDRPLSNPSHQYFGWPTWSNGQSGFDVFKAPDFSLNSIFNESVGRANASGIIDMLYLRFPFMVTSGSTYAIDTVYSMDVVTKTIANKSQTTTAQDYHEYVIGDLSEENRVFSKGFRACSSIPTNKDKFRETMDKFSEAGAGAYHDTHGLWGGNGCYADSHIYYRDGEDGQRAADQVIINHPQAAFSHYFNVKLNEWMQESTAALLNSEKEIPGSLKPGEALAAGLPVQARHSLAQGSEYYGDVNLKYTPLAINLAYNPSTDGGIPLRFSTEITRDDFISEIPLNPFIFVGVRRPDTWKQTVPFFTTVYGDRVITSNFAGPHLANAFDVTGRYMTAQSTSGYHPVSGYLQTNTATHPERVIQMKNWLASDLGMFSRLMVYHQSLDYTGFNPDTGREGVNSLFSGLSTEDHASVFSGEQWSGYFDFVKQAMRIQAYEPDYLYHGTIEHPLDEYNSPWRSGVFVAHIARGSNRSLSEPTGTLEEAIYHDVRRSVDGNGLLLWFTNWTPSGETFSGLFNPTAYDISSSYEVYHLDVSNTGSPGTKTYIETVLPRSNYTFNFTVPSGEYKVFEIVPTLSFRDATDYVDYTTDFQSLRYGYGSRSLTVNGHTIVYGYSSQVEDEEPAPPHRGFQSPFTQSIVNNLPQWMTLRQDVDSNGWKLVNSWGISLEELLEKTRETLDNFFLLTADMTERSQISYFAPSASLKSLLDRKNLLFNSSFCFKDVSRENKPAGWSNYGTGSVSYSKDTSSLIGDLIKITGKCSLSQSVIAEKPIGSVVCSCYFKLPNASSSVKLIVAVELTDGTSISSQSQLSTRSQEWRRLVLPLTINAEVYKLHFTIVSEGSSSIFVNAPQLEISNTVTNWGSSALDVLPWLDPSISSFNLVQAISRDSVTKKITIFPLSTDSDVYSINIPTRIERITSPLHDLEGYSNQEYGRKVSFLNEIFLDQWIPEAGKIKDKSTYPSIFDIFGEYDIRELRYFDSLSYGTKDTRATITPVASAIRKDYLFTLCVEESDNKTYYTLKIMKPRTPPSGKVYLESITDFDLSIDIETFYADGQLKEEISSIGFSEDQTILIVNTNVGRRYLYNMYFDYYYYDQNSNKLYTIEDYKLARIQII